MKLIGQNGKILQHAPKAVERARKIKYGIANVELNQLVPQIVVMGNMQGKLIAIFKDVVSLIC